MGGEVVSEILFSKFKNELQTYIDFAEKHEMIFAIQDESLRTKLIEALHARTCNSCAQRTPEERKVHFSKLLEARNRVVPPVPYKPREQEEE